MHWGIPHKPIWQLRLCHSSSHQHNYTASEKIMAHVVNIIQEVRSKCHVGDCHACRALTYEIDAYARHQVLQPGASGWWKIEKKWDHWVRNCSLVHDYAVAYRGFLAPRAKSGISAPFSLFFSQKISKMVDPKLV